MLNTSLKTFTRAAFVFVLLMTVLSVNAQNTAERVLEPDVPAAGVIDAATPAQVFTFVASGPQPVNLLVTSGEGLALTVVVTDTSGALIAQGVDSGAVGSVNLNGVPLPAAGVYFVTVFPAAGVTTETTGSFEVLLSSAVEGTVAEPVETTEVEPTDETTAEPTDEAAQTPSADTITPDDFEVGQVITSAGLVVELLWDNSSDMNLQVRDPSGQTLYFDSTTTNNGGEFGFDVNGLCEVLTPQGARETATWAPGALPTGSYEILVFYRQDCENNGSTDFTVNVNFDGNQLEPITGTLTPPTNNTSSVYLASFQVDANGDVSVATSGLYQDTRVLPKPAQELLAEPATPIARDVPVEGVIVTEKYYDLYTFDAQAGDTVAISMTALEGNLDTLLLVLDSNGLIIADNDDIVAGDVTDSSISSPPLRIAAAGTYTIMATRYGKDVGGTEGTYQLLLSGAESIALPAEVANLDLPDGDIEVLLTWNTNADLQLLVRDPAGVSVYDDAPTISSGGRLEADGNVNCTVSEGAPVSYIYWPFGTGRGGTYEVEVWYQNPCNDTRQVDFQLYITVNGQTIFSDTVLIQPDERYVTSFTIDATGAASPSDAGIIGGSETLATQYTQDDIANAPEIVSGQTLFGNITNDNKFDLYVFDGTAGQTVSINMRRTQGSLDTNLFLISPSGFEVAANDDAVPGETTDALIEEFTLPESGRYLIIATHFGTIYGGTTGSYQITMTLGG